MKAHIRNITYILFLFLLILPSFPLFSKTLPDIRLIDIQKEMSTRLIGTLQGKVRDNKTSLFILNFTSESCEPCNREIPELLSEYKKWKYRNIELIFIFVGDDYDKILKKTEELSIPKGTMIFSDPLSTSMRRMKFDGVPTTMLVNSNMEILERVVGYNQIKFSKLINKIEEFTK
ncbi:MAG: TlpA family protein disulfide reductase [Leptospiraceae bacterium]|nr:TlpA family protein disulfide reductase [Leptospiraceae bacterium]